ncbi:MAG: ABC-2 family transporter protein [Armatimonadetes bacterium]|nr:ABC-2 family transporter protein [Armatimonadota bacterium]
MPVESGFDMRRLLRIYKRFWISSLIRELEFKANFWAKMLQGCVWLGFFLLIVVVIFSNANDIAGWKRGHAFVLAAVAFGMHSIFIAFFMSLIEIPEQVRKGTLDFVVTKPVDSQFWVSLRRFNFDQFGPIIASMILIGVGLRTEGVVPSIGQWAAFLILLISSITIFYAFNFLLMTLAIYWVRVDNLWVLGETVMSIARYPTEMYTAGIQRVLIFALPVAFLASMPARQIALGANWTMVGIGAAWAIVLFMASRLAWNRAMSSYSSASS